ncbi:MAG: dihydroxy-acid dehydratase, partial [Betaproteobacteria bacterium]|nr:dihydroxy-acid dehydratase [Betaproteobacteria bacterium]
PARKLELKVSEAELAKRRAEWKPAPKKFGRGYGALFSQHVTQADKGCDFDFLHQTEATADPEIH